MTYSWTCPHCDRPVTLTENDSQQSDLNFTLSNDGGPQQFSLAVTACPNQTCKKITAVVQQHTIYRAHQTHHWRRKELLQSWRLIPDSSARVLPAYVPAPIVADYKEACMISDKSPKASATLSRRCLQGMIRDFYQISKSRLMDEINAIKDKVDPVTWEAIDAVRSIGNVGAHMEKDINLIVDVDEGEAKELIGLIELLIDDWYVTRNDRQVRLASIKAIAAAKAEAKLVVAPALTSDG